MKKILYLFTLILFVVASCDPMEEIYDELEEMDTGYSNSVTYTLTEDDYVAIAELTSNANAAEFIEDMMYFTDEFSAAEFVPAYLAEMYPALSEGSSAMITYKFNNEVPDELVDYTDLDEYELEDGDYVSADGVLEITKYYSPGYSPEVYIPVVLGDAIADPSSGDLLVVEYEYSDADAEVDFDAEAVVPFWSEGFDADLGVFTTQSVVGATKEWYQSGYGGDNYAKMSGYDSGATENEDWLVSEGVDLTGYADAFLNFRHAANYVSGEWDLLSVLISTDYVDDVTTATWTELTVPTWPSGSSWSFVESGDISLASYEDMTVYIAFKYESTATVASTWEIDLVGIGEFDIPVIGKEPETMKTVYEYSGGNWGAAADVYIVSGPDYDAMGDPGKYDNFSADDHPTDYIPALLTQKFPLAGEGSEKVVIYRYYTGISGVYTITLADTYVFTDGAWMSTYQYVGEITSQFLFSKGNWVFDPTVIFTMKTADYQSIVDWMGANGFESYVDSYGTGESYSGAGSYYGNFDGRSGKWDDTVFTTWDDAIAFGIGSALLPTKFPAAVSQVSGIDVFYIVNYATYNGANGTGAMKFQCAKSGPNPEFTFVEKQ